MKASYTKVGIGPLCMLFGKTRHAYYDKTWFIEQQLSTAEVALEMVAQIRREIKGIGTPKLYLMIKKPLQSHGIKMGRDALNTLLGEQGLLIRRRKRYVKTTDSKHWMKKHPNLLIGYEVTGPEQVWVADITFIRVQDDFNFLNLITDAYSRQIMGYCLFPTLGHTGTVEALQMALNKRNKADSPLIHHSDRGSQYCCYDYVELAQQSGIQISMTQSGSPYENPLAERVNGILKYEFDLGGIFSSRVLALQTVENNIKAYNELRPHMSCNFLTPAQAHQMTGPLEKKWKPKTYVNKTEQNHQDAGFFKA